MQIYWYLNAFTYAALVLHLSLEVFETSNLQYSFERQACERECADWLGERSTTLEAAQTYW